jgi:hypothetical protein
LTEPGKILCFQSAAQNKMHVCIGSNFDRPSGFSKNGDDVLDLDDEQAIVALEIDGDRAFGIEQDFIVLPKRDVRRIFDLGGNRDNPPGDRGNFDIIGQLDAALGLLFVFILANQDTLANWLNNLKRLRLDGFVFLIHVSFAPEM